MKHIKTYKNHSSSDNKEIGKEIKPSECDAIIKKVNFVKLTKRQIDLIEEITGKLELSFSTKGELLWDDDVDDEMLDEEIMFYESDINKNIHLNIYAIPDEYFLIEIISDYARNIFYKCDQFNELIHTLKFIIKNIQEQRNALIVKELAK